jgi:hypothetical protein
MNMWETCRDWMTSYGGLGGALLLALIVLIVVLIVRTSGQQRFK